MAATLVDSNVLLDIATESPQWYSWSAEALLRAADEGPLCINTVIYAEVSVRYESIEEVDAVIPETTFRRLMIPSEAAFLAAKAFVHYRRRGGPRRSTLPDFFIGAHAAVSQMRLLTRDDSRYRTYFPTVELVAPNRSRNRS